MSNKLYDSLKWIAQVFLPAFTTFYGVVATTCNFPYTEAVLTIMIAFDTFLGAVLGISSSNYKNIEEKENK